MNVLLGLLSLSTVSLLAVAGKNSVLNWYVTLIVVKLCHNN